MSDHLNNGSVSGLRSRSRNNRPNGFNQHYLHPNGTSNSTQHRTPPSPATTRSSSPFLDNASANRPTNAAPTGPCEEAHIWDIGTYCLEDDLPETQKWHEIGYRVVDSFENIIQDDVVRDCNLEVKEDNLVHLIWRKFDVASQQCVGPRYRVKCRVVPYDRKCKANVLFGKLAMRDMVESDHPGDGRARNGNGQKIEAQDPTNNHPPQALYIPTDNKPRPLSSNECIAFVAFILTFCLVVCIFLVYILRTSGENGSMFAIIVALLIAIVPGLGLFVIRDIIINFLRSGG